MPVSYSVIAASNPLATPILDEFDENTLEAGSGFENIRAAERLTNLKAWSRLPRVKIKFPILLSFMVVSIVSACAPEQLRDNTMQLISTLEDMRYTQLLTNISNEIDRADSVPSLGVTSSGTATSQQTGMLALQLTQPFDFTHNSKMLNPTVSTQWQDNWTITPVSDPQDLLNLRALYGLLYRTDVEIAELIRDNEILNQTPASQEQSEQCGISWEPPRITKPQNAMAAYFQAYNAFTTAPAPPAGTVTSPTKTPAASTKAPASKTVEPCYGTQAQTIASPTLAQYYGLFSPTRQQVATALRNGLSPTCRRYQLRYISAHDENGNIVYDSEGKAKMRSDLLFERWLFWKNDKGVWQPQDPPTDASLEPLGHYGRHDFWTAANGACVSDFIILVIHSTANSHAAALASSKGGVTPAIGP